MHPTAETLTAWSITAYGGPQTLAPVTRDLPAPAPTECLIRVRASAVTRADGMIRAGLPRFARPFIGWSRPRHDLIGTCLSGEVIAVGNRVTRFAVGDEVYGMAGMSFSANASHICVDEGGVLMHKPAALSHEEAAVMGDGATTSFNFLHNVAELRAGEKILILGAAGSLGTAAVQIAAAMGANVSGTCSAGNAGLVASLGASRVIDYRLEDYAKSTERYDVIYDTLGISSFREARSVLTRTGRYVCPVLGFGLLSASLRTAIIGGRKARFSATGMLKPEVQRAMHAKLVDLVEADRFAPVMDRTYPLAELVEAHRYMETGRKRGNVVVV
ncbi:NADPH:quinone reductase-like Zn-dependent oxidoreductase [Maritimibacter alkaliphilus HTCC2654]|uniref:NAD(P)-dependent alcohol dehydrogenase n=1 Tax=Maritimibacter alkaliphilus TaxID=404236 RepID=UPI0003170189|nr:NAD(P)-dependent alcohol dehydrogenase [Maritimibacter alkaliphilus]TYP84381.1 NADPH:quinone reductase-like Zn-dependent oxidoreductase [Maritimibacter alkaliphilus HTCC2654]